MPRWRGRAPIDSATEVTGIEEVVALAAQWSKLTVSPYLRRDAVRGTAMVTESTCPDSTVNARTHEHFRLTECEHFHFPAEYRANEESPRPPCELASPEQVRAGEHVQAGLTISRSVNHDDIQPNANIAAADTRDLVACNTEQK